jgi:ketosteroid isomerase-like protein
MQNDEQEIRQLVSTWMSATKAGDVEAVLLLMADDIVFLGPGQPVMRKADFALAARAQSSGGGRLLFGRTTYEPARGHAQRAERRDTSVATSSAAA